MRDGHDRLARGGGLQGDEAERLGKQRGDDGKERAAQGLDREAVRHAAQRQHARHAFGALQVTAADQDEGRRVLERPVGLDQLPPALVDRDVAGVEDERLRGQRLQAWVAIRRRRQLADEVGHDPVQLVLAKAAAVPNRGADRQEDVDRAAQARLGEPRAKRHAGSLEAAVVVAGAADALAGSGPGAIGAAVEEALGGADQAVVVHGEDEGRPGIAVQGEIGIDQPVVRVHHVGALTAQQPPQREGRLGVGQRRRMVAFGIQFDRRDPVDQAAQACELRRRSARALTRRPAGAGWRPRPGGRAGSARR